MSFKYRYRVHQTKYHQDLFLTGRLTVLNRPDTSAYFLLKIKYKAQTFGS